MKTKLLLFIFVALSISCTGQQYMSTTGIAKVHFIWNERPVEVHTENLNVALNYDNAEIKVLLDLSTVHSSLYEIDTLLAHFQPRVIEFTGLLDIGFVQTQKHPEQDFGVEGRLSVGNKRNFYGIGHLKHVYSNTLYTCVLNASFDLSLNTLGFDNLPQTFDDNVRVEILHNVMRRFNE
ncbi:MAG TPA: hypothetical protein VI603_00510 [Saprospiraceae bacterium]|nr:hypothetical protein [Saprospiraceae bacterium]